MGSKPSEPIFFKDHFSGHADLYARYRPRYPPALYEYLASLPERTELVLDCATGNGQAAVGLAPHFQQVVATDASAEQIAQARPHPRISYGVAPAEESPLADHDVDLVTVAQALHWLDLERFWPEVRRVLRPRGAVAVWCYDLVVVNAAVDAVIAELNRVVGSYWPPERPLATAAGFASIAFPFTEERVPSMRMEALWTGEDLLGYLGTWSSVRRALAATGRNAVEEARDVFREAWGNLAVRRIVSWPLLLRVGRPVA